MVTSPASPDVIFVGGTVRTVDDQLPVAEALAVAGDRIVAVGSAAEVTALRGPTTEVVDLDGGCLLPGFVEAHSHPTQDQLMYAPSVVDIRPMSCATADEVNLRVKRALDRTPGDQPLVFNGLDTLLQPGFPEPTREWLDELGPTRPIIFWQNSGHVAWANGAALRYARLPDDAPDPPGGHFERDEFGRLTGKAYEAPAILAIAARLIFGGLRGPELLANQHEFLASRGITTTSEMAFSGQLRPLIRSLYDHDLARARMRVYEMSSPAGRASCALDNGDDMFKQIGIKIWVDGSPWLGTIATSFPYLDTPATRALGLAPGHRGRANHDTDQLREIVAAYYPQGWQMSCHVHGDEGVTMILDVYEEALRAHPRPDHRLRLEHCGAMTTEQYRRAAVMGVCCSLFVNQLYYWGDVLVDDLFGAEHGAPWMRARSAVDAGMRISLHNDAPVTPEEPLRNISVAATRTTRSGRVLAPEERITVAEALRAETVDAAYQLFCDDVLGTLTPGKYADLVVLEADPHAVDPAEIADLAVTATYLAGRLVYER